MQYLIVSMAALIVAALTLFSGFGLGTLLMPVFAIFFPIELAVAATAVVHLANNIFKIFLVGRRANFRIVALFAIPASLAAMIGAYLLSYMQGIDVIYSYSLGSYALSTTPVKIVIGVLVVIFGLLELLPILKKIELPRKMVPIGGILSGFFGGLSGHQGALRTTFLIRLGMPKEVFVGTIVVSAVIVDIFRLAVYGITFYSMRTSILNGSDVKSLIIVGAIAAFLGSFIGSRLLKKITMSLINRIVGIMLLILGLALAMGIV
ncbi:MAG: sulfite exporter TauE/SafE family protein [Deltaproteobacteria bacterium]|jgi:uncharacterized protein|nr:sulfite exporter TauE/SafE family protein [Deltaproteobacteria bacterium]